jgi:hypothetical protein
MADVYADYLHSADSGGLGKLRQHIRLSDLVRCAKLSG